MYTKVVGTFQRVPEYYCKRKQTESENIPGCSVEVPPKAKKREESGGKRKKMMTKREKDIMAQPLKLPNSGYAMKLRKQWL